MDDLSPSDLKTILHSKRGGEKDYFYPQKRWRESLLALLQPQISGNVRNVVNLTDFRKGRGND